MHTIDTANKPTCGTLYLESAYQFCRSEQELWAFAAGHVSGNAEKVYLGACDAAMFRPQPESHERLFGIVAAIAGRYGLCVQSLPYELDGKTVFEIWISRDGTGEWLNFPVNSGAWHAARGNACGVPHGETDFKFHERKGWNEPCDKPCLTNEQSQPC